MIALRQSRRVGFTCLSLLFFVVSCAGAWEFSLAGTFTWEYYQFSQLGAKGFFGPYDQDRSTVPDVNLAARSGWLGHEITGNDLASGSDVAANYLYTVVYPKVKVNEMLGIEGSYRIGSWADPSQDTSLGQLNFSRYLNSQGAGIERSFSPGYWQTLLVKVGLPWGILTIGKAPNTISLGLMMDTTENTNEAVQLSVLYGPFVFGGAYYVWGPGKDVKYPLKTDRTAAAQPHCFGFLLYDSGNVSAHTYIEYLNGHQGPESQLLQSVPDPFDHEKSLGRINFRPVDISTFFGLTNFRYFNGRWFVNSEVGFHQDVYRESRSQSNVAPPRTRYWEFWGGMIECGAVAGPAKISLLWVYYPGPDRRAGRLIDRQPYIPGSVLDSGVNLYKPYSLLLGYDYGSGNNSITYGSNKGFISDANTYAVRLDYALAANLNAHASCLYARRVSQGYGWGWIRPNPSMLTSPALQYGLQGPSVGEALDLSFAASAPNILERDLGYEIGGGFDWKLIEGFTMTAKMAYWRPGAWFTYACVDRTQSDWNNPSASNRWGINPNREIDPIFGLQVCMHVNF
jgi:hypothetical protein